MARTILRKKNSAGGIIFLTSDYIKKPQSSKQYGTGMSVCTHTHTHTQNRHRDTDQWDRTDSLETKPLTYGQLIYNKIGKNIQWRKHSLFNKWF